MDLRTALASKLSAEELGSLRASFDVIGSIAIIEILPELIKKEKVIAETLLSLHKNITTVVKKVGIHKGELRLQKVKILAGARTKETEHKENGIRLLLNVEKVYFSPRLSSERKRIAEMVKPGESVLVMFSGCAPYPCVISKNSPAKDIVGIELNKEGHRYGIKNLALNKIKNAELYCGDVRKVVPKLKRKFNRVLMPLPRSAEDFLDIALKATKKGAIVHFYDFIPESEIPEASFNKVRLACAAERKKCKILGLTRCGQYSPHKYRVCVDFSVQ